MLLGTKSSVTVPIFMIYLACATAEASDAQRSGASDTHSGSTSLVLPPASQPVQGTSIGGSGRPSVIGNGGNTGSEQVRRVETVEHDFGIVWEGDDIKHTFALENTGDRVLGIVRVDNGCGCTATSSWKKQVQPGEAWKLDVVFATRGRQGKTSKMIIVKTDDPARPEIHLVMKGNIQPRFEISPASRIIFGALQAGDATKRILRIRNRYSSPVSFTEARATEAYLKADLREVEKGQQYELTVETIPPLPESLSLGRIVLRTDLEEQPQVILPVDGRVQPPVALMPSVLIVPRPVRKEITREIRMLTADGVTARLTGVDVSDPRIKVSVRPGPATGEQRISIRLPKGMNLEPGPQKLTVHTDHPDFSSLVCEIRSFEFGRIGPRGDEEGSQQ